MKYTNFNNAKKESLNSPEHSELEQVTTLNPTNEAQLNRLSLNNVQRARINPPTLTHNDILQLQLTIGNRKVTRLLQDRVKRTQVSAGPSIARILEQTVQRQLEGEDIESFKKWVILKLRTVVEDLEPKITNIIQTANDLKEAKDTFEKLKGLKDQDLQTFTEWAEAELGAEVSQSSKAEGIKMIATGAYSLGDAKRKFNTSKNFIFTKTTPNQPLIPMPQLKASLGLAEEPKLVFKKCTEMFEFNTTEGGLDRYVVWTGGASSCVAIGVYKDRKAALTHGTQLELERPEYRKSLIEKIAKFPGDGAAVYLVSETFGSGGTSYARDLKKELEVNNFTVTEHHSKSLAINAKNGKFAISFDSTGLPKKVED